jgi:hypothetical protein
VPNFDAPQKANCRMGVLSEKFGIRVWVAITLYGSREVEVSGQLMAGLLGISPSWLLAGHGNGPSEDTSPDVSRLLRELGRASEGAAAINKRVQQITASLEQIQRESDEPSAA